MQQMAQRLVHVVRRDESLCGVKTEIRRQIGEFVVEPGRENEKEKGEIAFGVAGVCR